MMFLTKDVIQLCVIWDEIWKSALFYIKKIEYPCCTCSACVCVCVCVQKTKFFIPTQLSTLYSGSQKSLIQLTHPFTHYFIVFIYYWTCSGSEYICNTVWWMLSNNQSINQSINQS